MSKLKLTVATVAITIVTSISGHTASAQDVGAFFDKFVPRGKLIQKFRNEVNGGRPIIPDPFSRDETPTPVSAAEAAKKLAAQRQGSATPNLAPPRTRLPVGNGVPTQNRQPSINANAFVGTNRQRTQVPAAGQRSAAGQQAAAVAGAAERVDATRLKAVKGFEMVVQSPREGVFVVTGVRPGGNAAEAGIQRGDRVTSIGGVELQSMTEYDEITKSMGGGDQLEFEIVRRDKKDKMLVQFGEPPALTQPTSNVSTTATATSRGIDSDFRSAPARDTSSAGSSFRIPGSNQGLQSVLE